MRCSPRGLGRTTLSAIGIWLALLAAAPAALAGSGEGRIISPNPAAFAAPGVTELSFKATNCSKPSVAQGIDAWVVRLEGRESNYFAVGTKDPSVVGYTFYVGFYDITNGFCDWKRGVVTRGNPTQALLTGGADWAVVSVFVGADVEITWRECINSNCLP